MNDEQLQAVKECAALSMAASVSFAEVVARLMKAGIERYHADYSRMENTYYRPDGASEVVPMDHERMPIAEAFSASKLERSVRQAQ